MIKAFKTFKTLENRIQGIEAAYTRALKEAQKFMPQLDHIQIMIGGDDMPDEIYLDFVSTKKSRDEPWKIHRLSLEEISRNKMAAAALLEICASHHKIGQQIQEIVREIDPDMTNGLAIIKDDVFYFVHESDFLTHERAVFENPGRRAPFVTILSDTSLSAIEQTNAYHKIKIQHPLPCKWFENFEAKNKT